MEKIQKSIEVDRPDPFGLQSMANLRSFPALWRE